MTPISFITPIKNRTNIVVDHNGNKIQLKLFENSLRALIDIITPQDCWEYIIVDFKSDDVNMGKFINSLPKKDNLTFKIHTVDQPFFDRGGGINIGVELASHPVIFVLDADMMIKSRKIFDDIEDVVVKQNKVLFPTCWYYTSPDHTQGHPPKCAAGNVVFRVNMFKKMINNSCWGKEDTLNYQYFKSIGVDYKIDYSATKEFIHQWHPTNIRHIYYPK